MPGERKRIEVNKDEEAYEVEGSFGDTREQLRRNIAELGE